MILFVAIAAKDEELASGYCAPVICCWRYHGDELWPKVSKIAADYWNGSLSSPLPIAVVRIILSHSWAFSYAKATARQGN